MPEAPPTKGIEQSQQLPAVFIVSRLPPAVCGVGDYTMRLIEHLRPATPPTMLVMQGADATRAAVPGLAVEQITADGAALLARLKEMRSGCVVLQYVGYGYHWRCCPLWLLRALAEWRRSARGARLVVMAHELWVRCAWWKPDWILQQIHRRALRRLAAAADQVFTSTEGYRASLADVVPAGRLRVLPIGSNIVPVSAPESSVREPGIWVLFGRQGSRLAALDEIAPWLCRLHTSGRLKELWLAGSRESPEMNAREDALAASVLAPGIVKILGLKSPEELSEIFSAAECGVLTQSPLSYTKSGIFMAYASHGVGIVSPNTLGAKEAPQCWVTHPSEMLEGTVISSAAVAERGRRLAEWYGQNASWPRIAAAYRSALGFTPNP